MAPSSTPTCRPHRPPGPRRALTTPASCMLLLAPLLCCVRLGLPVQAQISQGMCLSKTKPSCPPIPLCGVYRICKTNKVVVCSGCGNATQSAGPQLVCDFQHGRCVRNSNNTAGIAGAPCTAKSKSVCGTDYQCQVDTKAKGLQSRCCRSKCPPGAWGSPAFSWQNECGVKIACPVGAPPPPMPPPPPRKPKKQK